jgi:hypothetical protein
MSFESEGIRVIQPIDPAPRAEVHRTGGRRDGGRNTGSIL